MLIEQAYKILNRFKKKRKLQSNIYCHDKKLQVVHFLQFKSVKCKNYRINRWYNNENKKMIVTLVK